MPDSAPESRGAAPSPYPDLMQVSLFFTAIMVYKSGAAFLPPFLRGISGTIVMDVVGFTLLPLLMVLAQKRPWRTVFRVQPLQGSQWYQAIWLGLLTFVLIQGLNGVISQLAVLLGAHLQDPNQAFHQIPLALQLVVAALLPALAEEWAFRGFILSGALRLSPVSAAVFTGILFGALHGSFLRFIPLAVLGLVLSLAALRTGSILPGMFTHLLNNGIALIMTALAGTAASPHPAGTRTLLLSIAIWGAITIVAALGVRFVLRRLGPLPDATPGDGPAPWQRPWSSGERQFWLPLTIGLFIFLLFGLGEIVKLWGA